MKDMSVEVSTQNTMALKTLSPVSDLYPIKNGGLSDEDFVLDLPDTTETTEESQPALVKEMSSETEDEILNKFDTNDTSVNDTLPEDKLLEDCDELDTTKLNGIHDPVEDTHDSEVVEDSEALPKQDEPIVENGHEEDEELDKSSEELDKPTEEVEMLVEEVEKPTEDLEKPTEDLEKPTEELEKSVEEVEKSTKDLEKPTEELEKPSEEVKKPTEEHEKPTEKHEKPTEEHEKPTEELEKPTEELKKPTEEIKKPTEEHDKSVEEHADLLKDQIMDTEDLLQIVDNAPTENGHEEDGHIDTEVDEDFTTDDDQMCKEEFEEHMETKETSEVDVDEGDEVVPISEDVAIVSSENSSSGDKEDGLVIEEEEPQEKSVEPEIEPEIEEKDSEMVVEDDLIVVPEAEPSGGDKEGDDKENEIHMDADDDDATTKPTEETAQPKTLKRTFSDTESESEPKKLKLLEDEQTKLLHDTVQKITALNLFNDFMRCKTLKKLSRADLEEFCLQKMCEAIFHKSEVGELRHQLGVQEQMVEMWRKEVVQLSKQARDLEIVNKRLLHEVRQKNDRDKPLIPVKITRSVGLQVRSDSMLNMITPKRKPPVRPPPINVIPTIAPKPPTKLTPPILSMTKPVVTTPSTPKPKILTAKANALLSQALANSAASNASPKSPIKTITGAPLRVIPVKQAVGKNAPPPKVTAILTPTHSTKPVDKTFIDLTDEEEKRPQVVSMATASPTATTSVRIVKAATSVVTTNSVANSPRIMYVYNNQLHQGVLAADPSKPGGQKLMLKLNSNMMGPTNSVLTTVPSGSLAVGGTPLRPGHPVRLATPVPTVRNTFAATKATVLRHPAPLPHPPQSQVNIAARKPIPPRPHLTIRRSSGGIVLSWKMPYNLDNYEAIASYQLYAYQETSALPSSDMWRKVGDVKALALPMACTLTQFADGNKYHFAVRAVDVHKRMGQFSEPEQILL